jgi:hypothetical protein
VGGVRRLTLGSATWLVLWGAGFYHPPVRVIRDGRAGTPIATRAASALMARPGAWHTFAVVYRSRSTRGKRTAMSASVALPQ